MRTFIFLLSLVFCVSVSLAQRFEYEGSRTISVTGSAALTLVPDIIPIKIKLREYYSEEYEAGTTREDYETLIRLDTIQKHILAQLRAIGIPDSSIAIGSVGSTGRSGRSTERDNITIPVLLRKSIIIRVHSFAIADRVFGALNFKGIEGIEMGRPQHSKEQDYRRKIKTAALQAAKEKARYLVESVGAKLGAATHISEVVSDYGGRGFNIRVSESEGTPEEFPDDDEVAAERITIFYEMRATFQIE